MKHLITRSRRDLRRGTNLVAGFIAFVTLMFLSGGSAFAAKPAPDPQPSLHPVAPPAAISGPFITITNWALFVADVVFVILLVFGISRAATGNIDRKGSTMATWSIAGLILINGLGFFTGMFPQITAAIFAK